ncbi:hypothetical protein BT96DRAFT_102873 [Gymnopus androsaceus JB14]|uniref:Fungal STAND N-terminal Goodbye domain-containing protein n=1 Tax=Gymnopus androsaceus JB14 TaxID=1447944 RepID=A0A6A4GCF4_9AGAR|nr:hypothetical protein BT96DRAFT_102873 [Gymnopus androsaceus JB14]
MLVSYAMRLINTFRIQGVTPATLSFRSFVNGDAEVARSTLESLIDEARPPEPGRMKRSVYTIVDLVLVLNDMVAEAASSYMPGGKGILVAVGILLRSARGLRDRLEAIADLFCQFEKCLRRLQIRCNIRYEVHSRDTLVEIGVHLFHVLTLAQRIVKPADEKLAQKGQI